MNSPPPLPHPPILFSFSVLQAMLVLSLCLLLDGVHISANWFKFDLIEAAEQTDKLLDRQLP